MGPVRIPDKSTRLASGLNLRSPFAAMLSVFYHWDDCLWDATGYSLLEPQSL